MTITTKRKRFSPIGKLYCLLIILLCIIFVSSVQGQVKTAFEKRKEVLAAQFLRKIGISQTQINKAKQTGNLERLFLLSDFINKINTREGLIALEQFNIELKKAESLKTAIDFRRAEEKKKLDEAKKKAELVSPSISQNSDYSMLIKRIKENTITWLEKGEFEKTDVYQKRINEGASDEFQDICYNAIKEFVTNLESEELFTFELLSYDADKEMFGISFSLNDIQWTDSLKIPLIEAKTFKEDIEEYKLALNNAGWGFVNNSLYPKKIFLFQPGSVHIYGFLLPNTNLKSIVISAKDMGFKEPILNGVVFDYDNYYSEQLKLARSDEDKKNISPPGEVEQPKYYEEIPIYSRVEVEAAFPGGSAAWTNYLQRNLQAGIPKLNNAPTGTYIVIVKFIVEKDGKISNVVCENDPGYGTCEEAIRVIKKTSNWTPAIQNGRNVNAYRRQPITFPVD